MHRRNVVKRRTVPKPDKVVEIPLFKSLEQMVNDPAILNEVISVSGKFPNCCNTIWRDVQYLLRQFNFSWNFLGIESTCKAR